MERSSCDRVSSTSTTPAAGNAVTSASIRALITCRPRAHSERQQPLIHVPGDLPIATLTRAGTTSSATEAASHPSAREAFRLVVTTLDRHASALFVAAAGPR